MEKEEEERGGKEDGKDEVAKRMRKLERRIEVKERQERKKNVIIRGIEVREGKRKEAVEEIFDRCQDVCGGGKEIRERREIMRQYGLD